MYEWNFEFLVQKYTENVKQALQQKICNLFFLSPSCPLFCLLGNQALNNFFR